MPATPKFNHGDIVSLARHPAYSMLVCAVSSHALPKARPTDPTVYEWRYQLRHRCLPSHVSPAWIPERELIRSDAVARTLWHRMGIY